MKSVAQLGHVEVLDVWGRPVFFRELWQGRVTLLALVRHFGCLFCHEQAAELVTGLPQIQQAGGELVLLGNGNPVHANEFSRFVGLGERVYTDPARILYRALGTRHGMLRTVNLDAAKNVRRAHARGYRQRGVRGDRWQLGGIFVIDPEGYLAYAQRSEVAGDAVPLNEPLEAIERAARSKK